MSAHPSYMSGQWSQHQPNTTLSKLAQQLPGMVRKKTGTVMSEDTVKNLLRTLKLTGPVYESGDRVSKNRTVFSGQRDKLRQDLQQLNEDMTSESAYAFGDALWGLWEDSKYDISLGWLAWGAGFFGNDTKVLEMYKFMQRSFKDGRRGYQIARCTLGALMSIDSPMARMTLMSYGRSTRMNSLQKSALEYVQGCARRAGCSLEEFEDTCVPDCGMGTDGKRMFSYGERTFEVTVGENFYPVVRDEQGKVHKNLPRARKTDDVVAVGEAKDAWNHLKGSLIHTFKIQFKRLERMMLSQRTWHVECWEEHLRDHPVMVLFTKNLLWVAEDLDTGALTYFRVAEDRTLASEEDEEVKLSSHCLVRLAHPALMEAGARQRWGDVFVDYELIAPFQQLGRPLYEDVQRDESIKGCIDGLELDAKWVRIFMKNKEFTRTYQSHSVMLKSFSRQLVPGENVTLCVELSPGLDVEDYTRDVAQSVASVSCVGKGGELIDVDDLSLMCWGEAMQLLTSLVHYGEASV